MSFNEKLRETRKDRDTSQEEIATILNMTRQQYSLYETGKRSMPVEVLIDFCKHFKISADYILELPKDCVSPR